MHHALAWQHSYIVVRGSISEARPLGKVHKSGHAILCVLTSAYNIYIVFTLANGTNNEDVSLLW